MYQDLLKRGISILLCCAMLIGNFPVAAFAQEQDVPCEHHQEHDGCTGEECDFVCEECSLDPQDMDQTESSQPAATQGTEPVTTEPAVTQGTEPVTTEPAFTQGTESVTTEPAVTQGTEPVTTEPAVTQGTEPAVTEPAATEPEETQETVPEESQQTEPVCTGLADCPVGEHESGCLKAKAEADRAAADAVAELIAALPTLEEVQAKPLDEQSNDYTQVQYAYSAYEALTADQQALLPPAESIFRPYFEYFNSMVQPTVITSGNCGTSMKYSLADDGTLTITGSGEMTSRPWNSYSSSIKKVVMKGGTSVYANAFSGCTNLTEVTFPSSLTSIGNQAFYQCTALTSVTIPAKVTSVGKSAFADCTSLTSIQVNAANTSLTSIDGVVFTKDGTTLVAFPYGRTGTYRVPDGVTTITETAFYSHEGLTGIEFPDSLTTIEDSAFQSCGLTSVSLPDSVTTIGESAFCLCINLVSVKLPKNLDVIPSQLFSSCEKLETVTMPAAPTSIGTRAFWYCKGLKSIAIPETVTAIGDFAFVSCQNLTELTVPASVTNIGKNAFQSCSGLKNVTFKGDAPKMGDEVFYKVNATVYYSLRTEGWEETSQGYHGSYNLVWYPYLNTPHIHGYNTSHKCSCDAYGGSCGTYANWIFDPSTGILYIYGRNAMTQYSSGTAPWYNIRYSIEQVVVMEDITTVGDYSFFNCLYLEEVSLPERLTTIGSGAFSKCSSLESITLPSTLTTIGAYAFNYSALRSIAIPAKVNKLDATSLNSSYLEDVYYANSQTAWDKLGCTPSGNPRMHYSVADPSTHWNKTNTGDTCLTGGYITENCKCTNSHTRRVKLPIAAAHSWSTSYPYDRCTVCAITGGTCGTNLIWTLDIFGQLTISGTGAMGNYSSGYRPPWYNYRNSISSLVVEEGVTTIGENAFGESNTITQVTLPKSLQSIGGAAFAGSSSMERVNITDLAAWLNVEFLNNITSNPLYFSADLYLNGKKVTDLVIPEGITEIKNYAFCGCSSIQSVTIPEGVTAIGDSAFESCQQLTTVSLPDTLTSLGMEAFYRCKGLLSVTIPGSVTSIGSYAFSICSGLRHVVVEEGVQTIGSAAFSSCGSLVSIVLPKSLTKVGSGAFNNVPLTHVLYTGTKTQWNNSSYTKATPFASSSVTRHFSAAGDEVSLTKLCTGMTCECSLCNKVLFSDTFTGGEHNLVNHVCTKCGYVADLSSGKCGENLSWALAPDGTLTVTGTGAMTDYSETGTVAPWLGDYRTQIKKLVIREGVTSVGSWAFQGCTSLTRVEISGDVETIGSGAFSGCTALKSVTLPEGMEALAEKVFYGCTALTDVSIPATMTAIGSSAFDGCTALRYIALPAALTTIGSSAFDGCTNLWHVLFAGTETAMEAITLDGSGHTQLQNAAWHSGTSVSVISSPGKVICLEKILHKCSVCDSEVRVSYPGGSHTWQRATCVAPKTCSVCKTTEGSVNLNIHDYKDGVCTLCGIAIGSLEAQWPYAGRSFYLLQRDSGKLYYSTAMRDTAVSSIVWLHCFESNSTSEPSGQRIYLEPDMDHPGKYLPYVLVNSERWYLNMYYSGYVHLDTYTYTEWSIWDSWEGTSGNYLVYEADYGKTYVPTRTSGTGAVWDMVTSGSPAYIKFTTGHQTHTYTETVIKPTCTKEGYTLHRCTCGLEYKTDIKNKLSHNYSHQIQWAEDNSAATITLVCSVCADNAVLEAEISESVIKPVTCTADGQKRVTATVERPDGGTLSVLKTVTIPSAGHSYVEGVCVSCGEHEDPCWDGHELGDWTVTVEATCVTDGTRERICRRNCGYTETDTVPKGQHAFTDGVCQGCGIAGGKFSNGVVWTFRDGVLTVSGSGEIPHHYLEHPWDAIADQVTAVTVEPGITHVGSTAFSSMQNLSTVTLPEGLTHIDNGAFSWCTSLTQITLPDSLTYMHDAFTGSGLTSIHLGANLETVEGNPFAYCYSLTGITISEDNPYYCGQDGILFSKDKTGLVVYPAGKQKTEYDIPASVTKIHRSAFTGNRYLTRISVPGGITELEKFVFTDCAALEEISLPDSLLTVGYSAFGSCVNLKQIQIPANVTTIGEDAFMQSGLEQISIGRNVQTIGTGALSDCVKLTDISVDAENAAYCDIDGVLFSKDKKNLLCYPEGKAGESYAVPEGVTAIGDKAFWCNSALTQITLPESLETIGKFALTIYNLRSIVIPENVTSIGHWSLSADNLEKIRFLGDCPNIDEEAFKNVTANAYYPGDNSTWTADKLQNYGGNLTWGVQCGSGHSFVDHVCTECGLIGGTCGRDLTWKLEEGILIISGTGAMNHYQQGTAPWYGFRENIKGIKMSNDLTSVGSYAFYGLSQVTQLTTFISGTNFPERVTAIGKCAFSGCSALKYIALSKNFAALGDRAFEGCTSLSISVAYSNPTFTYHNGALLSKDYSVLFSAPSVSGEFRLEDETTQIANYAFAGNTKLWKIESLSSLSRVGQHAFDGCALLREFFFRGTAPAIGENAFRGVTATGWYVTSAQGWDTVITGSYGGNLTWKGTDVLASWESQSGNGWSIASDGTMTFHGDTLYEIPGGCHPQNMSSRDSWYPYRDLIKHVVIPASAYNVSDYAFYSCHNLESVTFEGTISSLGQKAFSNCSSLTEVTFQDGVTSLGEEAFAYCINLKKIYLHSPGNKMTVDKKAFYHCYRLEEASLYIWSSIGVSAFEGCTSLKTIYINSAQYDMSNTFQPDATAFTGVTATVYCPYQVRTLSGSYGGNLIWKNVDYGTCGPNVRWSYDAATATLTLTGTGAISGYSSGSYTPWLYREKEITSIYLSDGITDLPNWTFEYCEAATTVRLPDTLEKLAPDAFNDCGSLNNLLIPRSVTKFYGNYFNRCYSLSDLYYLGTAEEWAAIPNAQSLVSHSYSGNGNIQVHCLQWTEDSATCTEAGVEGHYAFAQPSVYACYYDAQWNKLDKPVFSPALDHDMGEWVVTKDSTCTQEGSREKTCKRGCGHTETDVISVKEHSYGSVVTEPTCTEAGFTTHTCSACGDSYVDDRKPALDHDMGEWETVTEVTCTEDGKQVRTCKRSCGYSEEEHVTAPGHSYESVVTEPTCTEEGFTTYTCSACGDSYVDDRKPALDHDMGEWETVTEVTCTEDGKQVRTCKRSCGYSEEETITSSGHSYEAVTTAPTCERVGYTTHTCTVCGDTYIDGKTAALGHDMGEWMVVKEANCTETGIRERHCKRGCEIGEPQEIPVNNRHIFDGGACTLCGITGGIFQNGVVWTFRDGVLTVSGNGELPHRNDEDHWASIRNEITTVIIEEGITQIGSNAFDNMDQLSSVTLPEGLTRIGSQAFYQCASLKKIQLPESLLFVDHSTFAFTGLSTIHLGANVKSLGRNPFVYCDYLQSITVSEKNETYCSRDGVLFNKAETELIVYPSGKQDGEYSVPNAVNRIHISAFAGNEYLTRVSLPKNVAELEGHTFANCTALYSVALPDGLQKIGESEFAYCGALQRIQLPESVTTISRNAFHDTGLRQINIGKNVQEIHARAFGACDNLSEISVSEENEAYCDMDGVLFTKDQKTLVTYPGGKHQSRYEVPEGTLNIGECAFWCNNRLEELILPESLETIRAYALTVFKLQTLTFPANVETIGYSVFSSGLNQIRFLGDCPIMDKGTFQNVTATAYYNASNTSWNDGNRKNYGGTITWKSYLTGGDLDENTSWSWDEATGTLTVSGTGPMADFTVDGTSPAPWAPMNKDIKNLVIENGITSVGDNAFRDCTGLQTISLPGSLESIGESAFPAGGPILTTIDQTVRQWSQVEIGSGNEGFPCWDSTTFVNQDPIVASGKFGENVYWELDKEGNMEFFGSGDMYSFGATASPLYDLPAKHMTIGEGITDIGECAFEVIVSATLSKTLESVTIASTVEKIGVQAFTNCQALKTITFTGDAPEFAENSFNNVTATAYYPAGNDTWTEEVRKDYGGSITWKPYCIGSHTVVVEPGRDATCTEDGITEGRYCSLCGEVLAVREVISAPGHSYASVVTGPTCTEAGYTTHTCSVCGDSYVDGETPALKHSMDEWQTVRETTCTENGKKVRTCKRSCGYSEEAPITAPGHSYSSTVTKPTCTEAGYTTHTCSVCGDSYVDSQKPALKHSMGKWQTVREATCTENGRKVRTCKRSCGYSEEAAITAPGHSYESVVTQPTCTKKGFTTHTCSACGDSYVDSKVKAQGHNMSDWVIEKAPTCTKAGKKVRSCSRDCGHREETTIPVIAHSYVSLITKPTCTKDGHTAHTCSNCGHSYTDGETSALGHNLGGWTAADQPGKERRGCSRCDFFELRDAQVVGMRVQLDVEEFAGVDTVYVDGIPYPVVNTGEKMYADVPEGTTHLVTYTWHIGDGADVHTQYPTGMKVYQLSGTGKGTAVRHIPELDDLLRYSGSSIRITGNKGIRMITSITKANKAALTGTGLAGFTLLEYGTALCFASELKGGKSLVLGQAYTRSNYAYKKGVADPVFAYSGDLMQYTNVLVGFTNDQCKEDIAMRPYIILQDAQGKTVTLYGGTVYRSIGYIAWQNRMVFSPGTGSYNFVWDIIHHVYGNKYDKDYKG